MWTLSNSLPIIREIERVSRANGYHVALTGGVLYGGSTPRKDLDLVFYRIRQVDNDGMHAVLIDRLVAEIPHLYRDHNRETEAGKLNDEFCLKMVLNTRRIDFLFPENTGTCYSEDRKDGSV